METSAVNDGGLTDDGEQVPSHGQFGGHEESLYTKGYISYPRTETDQFDKGIDLKKLIEKQYPDTNWGEYARG